VNQYVLTARLRDPDLLPAMDELLTGWREHLAGIPEAAGDDTAAMITWPSRDPKSPSSPAWRPGPAV
jgi:hypothetical protein